MKKYILSILVLSMLVFTSCEDVTLEDFEDLLATSLTDDEIVSGLKEALNEGTTESVAEVSKEGGYLTNEIVKILLPDEVASLQSTINDGSISLFSGAIDLPYSTILDTYIAVNPNIDEDPFDELVTAMNTGAEQAAEFALPIFADAITSMSITDALNILQGNETAATEFFKANTSTALSAAFQPSITSALGDTKATEIYSAIQGFTTYEYEVANPISFLDPITVSTSDFIDVDLPDSIEEYAAEKAIDGLFYFVGEEEKKIRANPLDYASAIIQKVFGSDEAQGIL